MAWYVGTRGKKSVVGRRRTRASELRRQEQNTNRRRYFRYMEVRKERTNPLPRVQGREQKQKCKRRRYFRHMQVRKRKSLLLRGRHKKQSGVSTPSRYMQVQQSPTPACNSQVSEANTEHKPASISSVVAGTNKKSEVTRPQQFNHQRQTQKIRQRR